MTSTRSFVPNQLFTPPAVGTMPPPPPEQEPDFHFCRAASGTLHETSSFWPRRLAEIGSDVWRLTFSQGLPDTPGRISVPDDMVYPTPFSHSAEKIYVQALPLEQAANSKDNEPPRPASGRGEP
jgi:hypothetical protein